MEAIIPSDQRLKTYISEFANSIYSGVKTIDKKGHPVLPYG
jgi:hypothetical protein